MDNSPMQEAILQGNVNEVKRLISEGVCVDPYKEGDYWLLHYALEVEDQTSAIEITKALINAGADIHEFGEMDETPMQIACCKGFIEIVELLIDLGVGIEDENEYDNYVIYDAIRHNRLDVVRLLINRGAELHDGVSHVMNIEMLNLLIEIYGVEIINKPDYNNNYLLYLRLGYKPNILLISEIIKLGADVNIKYGIPEITPLFRAIQLANIELVTIMLDHGADRTFKDHKGRNPVEYARHKGHDDIATIIEDYQEFDYVKEPEFN